VIEPLKDSARATENWKGKWIMKFFSGLLSILEEQTRCYERVYQLKEAEQGLILSGNPQQLEENTREIERLGLTIHSLEKARQDLVESLAQQYGLSSRAPALEEVLGVADPESAEALQKMATRLVAVLERTSRINEDNAWLLRRSMDFIDRSIEVLTGHPPRVQTYRGDGRRQSAQAALTVAVDRQA